MNEIEIKDVQNVAQNMIVGSKQHALFNPVIGNNPNLVTGGGNGGGEAMPAAREPNMNMELEISVDTGRESGSFSAQTEIGGGGGIGSGGIGKVDTIGGGDAVGGGEIGMGENLGGGGIANENKGLNSQLYGMLKPCDKQFGSRAQNEESHEDNSEY